MKQIQTLKLLRSHDVEGTGCNLDPGQRTNTVFSCISSTFGRSSFKLCTCRCIAHIMEKVLGNISCELDLKVKVTEQILYFLVNASPQPLDVTASNFVGA